MIEAWFNFVGQVLGSFRFYEVSVLFRKFGSLLLFADKFRLRTVVELMGLSRCHCWVKFLFLACMRAPYSHSNADVTPCTACDGDVPPQMLLMTRVDLERGSQQWHFFFFLSTTCPRALLCSGMTAPMNQLVDLNSKLKSAFMHWFKALQEPRSIDFLTTVFHRQKGQAFHVNLSCQKE